MSVGAWDLGKEMVENDENHNTLIEAPNRSKSPWKVTHCPLPMVMSVGQLCTVQPVRECNQL